MGPAEDACPGPCNRRYRDTWTTHAENLTAWRTAWTNAHEHAAQLLADLPHDQPPEPELLDALDAITLPDGLQLPDPPNEPTTPCRIGIPVWCRNCHNRIRAALVELGDLAAMLEAWADGHRGAASGEHVPTRRATAPSPSPITDTLDALYGALAEVEAQWREHAGHQPRPSRARGADARQRTLNYLLEQSEHILDNPGSVRFGKGVLAWLSRLQRMAKTDPVVRSRPGRCPRCTWVNVLQTRDDGYTECRNCGRLLSEDEYQDEVVNGADFAVVDETRAARATA
jgi:hypothetical protein